jgi:putative peptidoglycan lipid II flippase
MLIAALIGTGPVGQAFVVAFRIPTLFTTFLAEGAFNSAFVPMFARRVESDGLDQARELAEKVFAVLFAGLILLTAAAQVAMPLVVTVIAPGFVSDPEKFGISVALTRIAIPYVLFMTLCAVLGGILNSLRRFASAAITPIALNVVMIVTLLGVHAAGWGDSLASGYAMVWSMCLSGIIQFTLLARACRRAGVALQLRWPTLSPEVKQLFALALPGLFAGAITQLNFLISTMVATGMDRAVSYLYFAERLYQLPLGVIGVAIGVVLLPEMSRRLRAGDEAGALANQNRALELAMFVTLPVAVMFIVIPDALIGTFFEHGAFSASDAHATAAALAAFAAGLPAYTLYKVFAPGFFARSDTRRPMMFALTAVSVNIAGSLTLPYFLGHVGLALSTAIAAWINTSLVSGVLMYRGHYRADARLRRRLPRTLLASLVMAVVLYILGRYAAPVFDEAHHLAARAASLAIVVALGGLSYLLMAQLLGAMTWQEARRMIRRS